ncbi:hypothetical protein GS485_11125 [Rhodococcus hoagii]|nr:hypothetical protein [Prescottella equi]
MSSTILSADLAALDTLRFLVGAGPSGVGTVKGADDDIDTGNDGDEDDDTDVDDDTDADEDEDDDKPLGPKGEKALAAMKEKRKQERARRIAAEAELRRLRAGKPAESDDADDDEKARIIEERITSRANRRIISAEVRAAAAGKLADPADAHKFLDLDQFEVGEDGEVDEDEIADAIDDLLKDKPYLAAQGGTRKTPKPDRRQGGGQRDTAGSVASGRAAYLARKNKTN